MSVGPRIIFTRFAAASSPKLVPWNEHAWRVTGITPRRQSPIAESDAESDDGAVVWQLLSANNRMLGRSVGVFTSFDSAVTDAQAVVVAGPTLAVKLVSDERRGMFGWYTERSDRPSMTCARWYSAERDRRHSLELALSSVVVALLHPGARQADIEVGRVPQDAR